MKTVELTTIAPALAELLDLACETALILKTPEGREFVLAEVDDLDTEIALVRQAKLDVSCRVEVPAEQGLTNHSYRVLRL